MSARMKDLIHLNRLIKQGEAYEREKGEKDTPLKPAKDFLPKRRRKKHA